MRTDSRSHVRRYVKVQQQQQQQLEIGRALFGTHSLFATCIWIVTWPSCKSKHTPSPALRSLSISAHQMLTDFTFITLLRSHPWCNLSSLINPPKIIHASQHSDGYLTPPMAESSLPGGFMRNVQRGVSDDPPCIILSAPRPCARTPELPDGPAQLSKHILASWDPGLILSKIDIRTSSQSVR
jgi:hypothetical protein